MSSSMDTVGPLARTVRDCALLLGAVAGAEPGDGAAIDEPVPDYCAELDYGVDGLVLGVDRRFFFTDDMDAEILAATERAIDKLAGRGARIVELEIEELDNATAAGVAVVVADTSEWHHTLLRERRDKYDPDTRVMLELGELMLAPAYIRAQRVRTRVQSAIRSAFETHGLAALVAPTIPIVTPTIERLKADATVRGDIALSLLLRQNIFANVIGVPSLSVPSGFTEAGMPIGMQLVGRPFDESTLFRIGHAYQSVTDWHERHPGPYS